MPIGLLALALLLFTLFAPRFGRYSDLGDNSDIVDKSDIAEPPEEAAQGGPSKEAESGSESEPEPELPKLSS